MTERAAGPIIDGLGVMFDLDDEDLVVEAVVVGKVSRMSDGGGTSLVIASSDRLDWIAQLGLLEAARRVTAAGLEEAD